MRVAGCEICALAQQKTGLVLDTHCWHVVVSYDQGYFGRCLVVAKNHVPSVALLRDIEFEELKEVMRIMEHAIRDAFGADLVNWECLMNHSFRQEPAQPHVHWHLRPRYRQPVEFDGRIYLDPNFGDRADPKHRLRVEPRDQNRIAAALKPHLRRPFV